MQNTEDSKTLFYTTACEPSIGVSGVKEHLEPLSSPRALSMQEQ